VGIGQTGSRAPIVLSASRYTVPQFVNGADLVGGEDIIVLEGDGFAENVVPW